MSNDIAGRPPVIAAAASVIHGRSGRGLPARPRGRPQGKRQPGQYQNRKHRRYDALGDRRAGFGCSPTAGAGGGRGCGGEGGVFPFHYTPLFAVRLWSILTRENRYRVRNGPVSLLKIVDIFGVDCRQSWSGLSTISLEVTGRWFSGGRLRRRWPRFAFGGGCRPPGRGRTAPLRSATPPPGPGRCGWRRPRCSPPPRK